MPKILLMVIYFSFILFSCVFCGSVKLSCEQIRAFVDGHNTRRKSVAQGLIPGQPPTSDMQFMTWDEELAEKASKWADKGIFAHNPDKSIGSRRWNTIGENIYISNSYSNGGVKANINIEEVLKAWFEEYKNYQFQPFLLRAINPFAHYTQMVWANTNRIGCGISQKKENLWTKTLFVCDYAPVGNYFDQRPYKPNAAGSQLQCKENICDKPYGQFC